MKNAFGDIKPQTRKETMAVKKEVDEIVAKVNKEVDASMKRTKEYIKRKVREKIK